VPQPAAGRREPRLADEGGLALQASGRVPV